MGAKSETTLPNERPPTPSDDDSGGAPSDRPQPQRSLFLGAVLFMLMLVLVFGAQDGVGRRFGQPPLDLMKLEQLLEKNAVQEIRFKDNQATVTLRPGDLGAEEEDLALVWTVTFNSDRSAERIEKKVSELRQDIDTKVYSERSNTFFTQLLMWFLPTLLLIGVLYFFLFRQFRGPGSPGSLMNFGKSRAKASSDRTEVKLADVAGLAEARQDIEEIIAFLRDPTKFSRLGGRIPKGVLLVGPPGCGKTLLAKATAGEAGVPFYNVSGSDFVEMFVGVGASRVRDLFEKAKETSPCIVFLDEVDAVGRRRGSGMGGGHDEREQTLNQILVEMDGFDTDRGIIVMAATNRPDILDPALLRPGRFDRQIVIGMPNVEAREQILAVHARDKKISDDVDLKVLARATPTFSGAELEALLNEAALAAAMADRDDIGMAELEEARDKIRWGRQKKSWKMVEEEVRATAYHEGGHALVAALVDGCDPLHKVTVVPRGQALGMTMSLPTQDQYSMSKRQIEARICMAFGGRIGEAVFTHDLSTGAQNDIEQATSLARRMITEWGMSEALGPVKYAADDGEAAFLGKEMGRVKEFSEGTMKQIDDEVRRVIDAQYERAEKVIADHQEALERIADALVNYETITGEEVNMLIDGVMIPRPIPAPTNIYANRNGNGSTPEGDAAADTAATPSETTTSETTTPETATETTTSETTSETTSDPPRSLAAVIGYGEDGKPTAETPAGEASAPEEPSETATGSGEPPA